MSEEQPQETTETTKEDETTNQETETNNEHQNGTKIETINENSTLDTDNNNNDKKNNNNNNNLSKEELERIEKEKEIEKVKREVRNQNGLANVSKDMVKRKSRNHRQSQEQRRSSIIMRNDKAGFANRIKKLPRTDKQIFLQKRHDIILDILRYLHLGIEVFNTICESDEFLDDNQLDNLPVFWFKQHDWKAWQIHFFYDAIVSTRNRDALSEEIDSCFHKKKRKRKGRRKRNLNPLKHVRRGSVTMLKAMSGNVRRQNKSMLFRVKNNRKSFLPLAQGIWNKFVLGRGGRDECKELNAAQWNIQLNDNDIIVDPDLSFELYIFLLDTKEKYDEQHDEDKMLQNYSVFNGTNEHIKKYIQTQNVHDEEEENKNENLSQHEKDLEKLKKEKIQRKRMKKTPLTEDHFVAMYVKVREVLDSKHGRLFEKKKPSQLDKSVRDLVIFKKIFEALLDGQKFDVQEEYLTQKLTEKELSKSKFILKQLSSRKSDWRHRLRVLEFVEENLEKPNKFHSLLSDENFKSFIFGWTAQMLDDRSQLSSTAVTLFPSVLGTLITKKDSAYLFFEDNLLTHVFGGIFTVLRGRRAKELSQFAEDCAVRVIDIFGNLAEGGEEELSNWGRSRSVTLGPNETKFLNVDSPMNSPPISPTSRKDMQFMLDKLNEISNDKSSMNNLNIKKPKNLTNTGTQTPNRNPGLKKKISLKISTDDTKSPQTLTRTRGRSVKSPTIAKLASQFETEFPETSEKSGSKTPTRRKRGSVHVRGKKKTKVVKKKTPISKDVYMDLIEICLKHSTYKIEKHEKVRAATMTMASYLIYGIDNPILESDNLSTNSKDEKDDEKSSDKKENQENALKPNKTPSRAFLMSIDPFVQKLKLLVSNGVSDRGESVRLRCMNLIKRLEKTFGSQKLDDLLDKEVMYKYKKWEKRQNYNKEKNKKVKKNSKKSSRNANRMKMARMRAQAMKKKKLEQQKKKKQQEEQQNNNNNEENNKNDQNTDTNNNDENTG